MALIASVTALAAALRIFALGEVPPGLYHDEAFNGLDALKVLAGQRSIYFAANHGREPLFIYLIAATVGLLGRTPGALRLAAALCGTLTIPATYLMARTWLNRRVGLLSAAILAITLWHVHLSRIGFRAVTLPLTTALTLWLGARAYRSRRRRDWLLAGLLYGSCFYAYLPARFTPVALAAFALYLALRGQGKRLWPGAACFAVGTALTLAPLALYTLNHWDIVLGRPGQVSVFNPRINGGNLWGTLGRQLVGTLGMFFVRGDTISRHNLPGRAVFDLLLGAAMVWGLAWAMLRARRGTALAFTLIWVGLLLVPTWLAEDAPHFLRAVGVLPLLVVLPALGLERMAAWLEQHGRRTWAVPIVCAVLATSLAATMWDYFVRYGTDPQTAYAFENAATELAAETNRFTGAGWDGNGLATRTGSPKPGQQVYVDSRLWDEWAAIPFLVPETGNTVRIPTGTTPFPVPPLEGENMTGRATLLLLWPYKEVARYQNLMPPNARVEVRAGSLTQGDMEETAYVAYVAYTAEEMTERPTSYLARFGEQIALAGYEIETGDQEWQVRLEWVALEAPVENYTIFVHLRDGERLVDQNDGEPSKGHYPTNLWRSGDLVVDTRTLEPPSEWKSEPWLAVGLYRWPAMERLAVVTQSGEFLGNEFIINNQQ